jgi:hypothetical protein
MRESMIRMRVFRISGPDSRIEQDSTRIPAGRRAIQRVARIGEGSESARWRFDSRCVFHVRCVGHLARAANRSILRPRGRMVYRQTSPGRV